MANRTDTQADTVHGTNPQYLVDRIIRVKIYNDAYWKEFCFGLTTESFVDRAAEIDYVGGTYGGRRRPAKFLCLFLKMLQIQPDEDVVMEYIKQADFKYLRALGAAYLRISARPTKVFQTLEPLFADYRKLRYRDLGGKLSLIHMDEFIDWLLREETVCDVTMPQLPKREVLEQTVDLPLRQSVLEDDLAELDDLEEAAANKAEAAADRKEQPMEQSSGGAAEAGHRSPVQTRASPSPCRRRSRSRRNARERSRGESVRCRREKKAKEKKEKEKERKERADKEVKAKSRGGGKNKDGLSVDEWNQVRKELGLNPLKT